MEAKPASLEPRSADITGWLMRPVEFAAAVLVFVLTCLIFAGSISRYAFNMPLYWSDEVATLMFLWLSMLGAVIAAHRNEHLRLSLVVDMLSDRLKAK